jgi:hypothetical protein
VPALASSTMKEEWFRFLLTPAVFWMQYVCAPLVGFQDEVPDEKEAPIRIAIYRFIAAPAAGWVWFFAWCFNFTDDDDEKST